MKILQNGFAVIEGDTHHAVWVNEEGLIHDKFIAMVIRNLIKDYKVSVAVDGGANIGTLTAVMLDAGIEVHAFEPNPQAIECLKHNCPKAVVHQCGLGMARELKTLITEANAGASFISKKSDGSGIPVRLAPLDAFDIRAGLIKLDVEGFEVEALLGAQRTIQRMRPIILCEVNFGALDRAGFSAEDLYTIFKVFGYTTEIVQPDCRIDSPQYDIIAKP